MIYRLFFAGLCFFALSANADEPFCAKTFSAILNSDAENADRQMSRVVLEEITDNYQDVDRRNPERIATWNRLLLKELRQLPESGQERGRLSGLTHPQIYELYDRVAAHPVAAYTDSVLKKYDPKGNIGFCFGRAMTAHLEALQTGLAQENIRKVWAVGTMKYKNIYWKHHVATLVRDKNGGWYTIDPEYGKPLKLSTWFQKVKAMDADNKLQFFVTPAKRFAPENSDTYSIVNPLQRPVGGSGYLKSEFYNGYFVDLLEYTRQEAAEIKRMRDASSVMNK